MPMSKFVALYDLHWGYERKNGHKIALHDPRALDIAMQFIHDFKPDALILGGDILDCGAISHHNHGKPGRTEGLRILSDAEECFSSFIEPLHRMAIPQVAFIPGNHEDWLNDLEDANPGIRDMMELKKLLHLPSNWKLLPHGGAFNLGKLTFVHGDQLRGGEHVAKAAVIDWERSIRFGHYHTHQVYTKTSPLDVKQGRTGMAVGCLCTKDPKYGEGKANKWVQGFNFGYVERDGSFHDYHPIIINNRAVVEGKVYRG